MPNAVVLVAEDDVALLDLMVLALEENLDVRVIVARDSLQALRWVKCTRPDLIVLDVELPGIAAAQVVRQLKFQPETDEIPVIAVNPACRTRPWGALEETLVAGCEETIQKPFNADTFAQTVRRHLPREKAYEKAFYAEWQLATS